MFLKWPLLRRIDALGEVLGSAMLNIAFIATRTRTTSHRDTECVNAKIFSVSPCLRDPSLRP